MTKIRMKLRKRYREDVDDPRATALARMEAAGYFRQAAVTASRPQLPPNTNPKLRAALDRLYNAPSTVADSDVGRIFGPNIPDYNALANHAEKVRRLNLGYDDEPCDTFAEDDDVDERPVPPTNRRRMLFPDAPGLRPLSWNDVED